MPTQAPVGRPERAVERNRILEFSSKISLNTLKYYIYVRVNFAKVLPLLSWDHRVHEVSIVRPSIQNPPYLMDFLDLKS